MRVVRKYPKMNGMKNIVFTLSLILLLASCNRNPQKINVSNVSVDLKIRHLDAYLLKQNQDQMKDAIPLMKRWYGDFFDIFTYRMIAIGGTEQPNFPELLYSFVSDTLIRKLEQNVTQKVDTIQLRKELESAFKHYKYYFPSKEIPIVYTCISGFNQSVVISEKLIGVSLDKYMGADSPFYEQLGLPVYKRKNMHPEKIVPDMMQAWADAEWPKSEKDNSLLSHMIQQGKVLYFMDAMLPDLNDTLKIGFSEKQLEFCRKNEAKMWTYLAEHKMLFTTDRMSIKRFIDDGPYTATFSEESPARTGVWLGWQIVRSYMKQNKDIKLADLMNNSDDQSILNQSGYRP
jgi:gliding motility-associated lipoprotein GldB